jgi:hypothetical protein
MSNTKYMLGLITSLFLMVFGMVLVLIGLFPPELGERTLMTVLIALILGVIFLAGGAFIFKWSMKLKKKSQRLS